MLAQADRTLPAGRVERTVRPLFWGYAQPQPPKGRPEGGGDHGETAREEAGGWGPSPPSSWEA